MVNRPLRANKCTVYNIELDPNVVYYIFIPVLMCLKKTPGICFSFCICCWLVRGSLFIELRCPRDLGKGWRGNSDWLKFSIWNGVMGKQPIRANQSQPHANLMPTLCQPHTNLVPTSCQPRATSCKPCANLVPTSYHLMPTLCQPCANLVQTSCKAHINLMSTLCEPHVNLVQTSCHLMPTSCHLMPTSCQPRATSYQPLANLMQTSCQPHANLVPTSWQPHANLMLSLVTIGCP